MDASILLPTRVVVELYTKPGCSLCVEALEALDTAAEAVPFALQVRNVFAEASLWERYRYDVPVVLVNGRVCGVHRVNAAEVEAAVREAQAASTS